MKYPYNFKEMPTSWVELISKDKTALPSARKEALVELEKREHPWVTYSQAKRIVKDHKQKEGMKYMARKKKGGWHGEPIRHARAARGIRTAGAGTRVVKVAKHQIGRRKTKADRARKALKPGKRVTAWGTVYVETRGNRSDKYTYL